LKESLDQRTLKKFMIVKHNIFKVFRSPEPFLQKGFWWGAGVKPLRDKPQFRSLPHHYTSQREGKQGGFFHSPRKNPRRLSAAGNKGVITDRQPFWGT
jgi:hypothetical protein